MSMNRLASQIVVGDTLMVKGKRLTVRQIQPDGPGKLRFSDGQDEVTLPAHQYVVLAGAMTSARPRSPRA